MSLYVIGIDPGTEMGVAVMARDGIHSSWQGNKHQRMKHREYMRGYMRKRRAKLTRH